MTQAKLKDLATALEQMAEPDKPKEPEATTQGVRGSICGRYREDGLKEFVKAVGYNRVDELEWEFTVVRSAAIYLAEYLVEKFVEYLHTQSLPGFIEKD